MRDVLGNAEIGGFEVESLVNPDVGEMRSYISDTFAATPQKRPGPFVLHTATALKISRAVFI